MQNLFRLFGQRFFIWNFLVEKLNKNMIGACVSPFHLWHNKIFLMNDKKNCNRCVLQYR